MCGIRDGSSYQCNRGIHLEQAGPVEISNVAFGATTGPSAACIDTASEVALVVTNCQGEGVSGGDFLRVTGSASLVSPITLQGCTVNLPVEIQATRRILSIGNHYTVDVTLTADGSTVTSIQDAFDAGKDFVKVGVAIQVQKFTPNGSSPFMETTSNVEGVVHRFRATGSGVNPSIELRNDAAGGGDYYLLFPGTGGLVPGGFMLRDGSRAINPIIVDPNAPEAALRLSATAATLGAPLTLTGQTTGTTAPAAGGAGALPATPAGYLTVTVNGVARKVPYY
jgi:hypothetical protein